MSMSRKKRRHAERSGRPVTTRPKVWGPSRREVKATILEHAGHRCAWCGAQATMTAPRALGAGVKGSVCWNAAWCGMCDPDIRLVGVGPPSRFAVPDPGAVKPRARS